MPSISSPSFFIKDGSKRNYFHILVVIHVNGSPQPYLPYVFQCNLAFHLRTAFSNICNLYNEREQTGHVLRTRISRFLSVWRTERVYPGSIHWDPFPTLVLSSQGLWHSSRVYSPRYFIYSWFHLSQPISKVYQETLLLCHLLSNVKDYLFLFLL